MSKVICYPRQNKPTVFESDAQYFEMFSTPEEKQSNIGHIGAQIISKLRQSKICPTVETFDFLMIALAVVAADRAILRSKTHDGWTRMIELSVCLHEPEKWSQESVKIEKMLRFLTGDFWHMSFQKVHTSIIPSKRYPLRQNDCVCLLSGGMDSLVGAIDLTEAGRTPLFVSQIVRGDAEHQREYADSVGSDNLCQWSNYIKVHGPSENTTRARSLLFFAFASIASCGISSPTNTKKEIYVPENGFISLNIPLSPLRISSLSTKTTHPVYMTYLQEIWNDLNMNIAIILPYKFKTKGEVLIECRNQELMRKLIFGTTSCGKYQRHGLRHCGTCVPCLVRRASFIRAGMNDETEKGYCVADLKDSSSQDLAAAAIACVQVEKYGVGSLIKSELSFAEKNEKEKYQALIERGIREIRQLLEAEQII